MSDDTEATFDTVRLEKPMSQAELIFQAIRDALKEEPGSHDRTMRMADVQSLLAAYIDGEYETDCKEAKASETDENMDGRLTHADFQAAWLAAMMRLVKRSGLSGKEYVEG